MTEEKDWKWQADKDIPSKELLTYIEDMGAANITEIKSEFTTNSRAVRRAIGKLLYNDKILLAAYQSGVYVHPVTGQKGRPNIKQLRRKAGVEEVSTPRSRGKKSGRGSKSSRPLTQKEKDDLFVQSASHEDWGRAGDRY